MRRWIYEKLGIISPSLYYSDRKYREKVENMRDKSENSTTKKVLVAVGWIVIVILIGLFSAGLLSLIR